MKKALMIIGLVLLLSGVAFAFLPHEVHNAILGNFIGGHEHHEGMEHGSHNTHLIAAYVLMGIGLLISTIAIIKK